MRVKLDWMREVKYEDLLTEDCRLILDNCGEEVLFKLLEKMSGLQLFISTKPIKRAQKRYIKKHYNGANAKQLALRIGASERFVYNTIQSIQAEKCKGKKGNS